MATKDDSLSRGESEIQGQVEPTREEEHGEASEPDAPTAEEENEGMNTILDANPLTGVQDDAGDE